MTATAWQTYLATQGATLDSGAIADYGDAKDELVATASGNVLCDLSHLGLLKISGADAVTFLQGQVTNDVKLLTGTNAHYSAYCNPKGRMLALFLAFAQRGHLCLQFNRTLFEPIMKRLKMYVMRSKVEIQDVSESVIKFGINGPKAASILASSLTKNSHDKIPAQDYALVSLENVVILKLPSTGKHARFQILTDAEHAPQLWSALKTKCRLVGKPCWDWLEIQAGIPDIAPATQEQFVPQMLNLDVLHGISFKKGCYTGQEIVARTHYLGSVKRRSYLTSINTSKTPRAGDTVSDATQNAVGQIVRVTPNLSNGYDALIEMRIDAQHTGKVFWNDVSISMHPLPYSIDA